MRSYAALIHSVHHTPQRTQLPIKATQCPFIFPAASEWQIQLVRNAPNQGKSLRERHRNPDWRPYTYIYINAMKHISVEISVWSRSKEGWKRGEERRSGDEEAMKPESMLPCVDRGLVPFQEGWGELNQCIPSSKQLFLESNDVFKVRMVSAEY
ncbi:hypothetical protein BJ165DRAFT_318200 [Panaeolus papilionaceus]|nr:hypothetical protein BJ165DRAFT_318200 [Panaeolus papilionaceus]